MAPTGRPVFLSYASQDAEIAQRIAAALESAGVPVWLDRSALRGGDAWDAMIRERIRDCALFVPVVSAATEQRAEGYFRLEWRLAVERAGRIADDVPFLLPIAVADIAQDAARVPSRFRDVQWSAVRDDEDLRRFATRIAAVLAAAGPGSPSTNHPTPGAAREPAPRTTDTAPARAPEVSAPRPGPAAMSVALQAITGRDPAMAAEVTRDLTGMLTRSSTLVRVVPVPATGVPADIAELAWMYQVRHVAQGVLRDGGARVDLSLSDGHSRQQLWSESFVLPPEPAAREGALRTASWRLSRAQLTAEQRRILAQPGEDDTATELVVRALALDRSEPVLAKRIPQKLLLLDEACRREPQLVSALVGTAIALHQQLEADLAPDRDATIRRMDDVTSRAVLLAEMHPAPWVLRAASRMASGRWQAALDASARALRLEPRSMGLLEFQAGTHLEAGRPHDALRILEEAAALEATGHYDLRRTRCLVLLCLGRYEEAADAAEPVRGAVPEDPMPDAIVAAAAMQLGDTARAAAALAEARQREPRLSLRHLRLRQLSVQPDFLRLLDTHLLAPLRAAGLDEE